MAKKTAIGSSGATQYTRSYGELRGVDFSSDPAQVNVARPSYLINMYRDYDSEHGAAIETIPGYRRLFHFGGRIHGIWGYSSSQDDSSERYMVVHAGTKLFTFKMEEKDSGLYEERFDGLRDSDSTAFLQNNNFYICDGAGIYVMKADLSVVPITEDAYVPVTYLHGAAYEQRNMISDKFINRDTAIAEKYEFSLEAYLSQLDYKEYISYDGPTGYTIKGFSANVYDELYWPAANSKYSLEFEEAVRKNIKRVYVTYLAQIGNTRITTEYREEVEEEYNEETEEWETVFVSVPVANHVYLDMEFFPSLKELYYSGLTSRDGTFNGIPTGIPTIFENIDETIVIGKGAGLAYRYDMVISDPCVEILSVKVNDVEIPNRRDVVTGESAASDMYYEPVSELVHEEGEEHWYMSYIHIHAQNQADLNTKIVDIKGVAKKVTFKTAGAVQSVHTDYISANTEYEGTSSEAILGCGIATTFDGRVFLTGNAKLPNTVFYSCRDLTGYNNPAYYGVYNYFNDGEGNDPNVALLSTSGVLMVLKRNTLQGSAIYYHTGAEGIDDVVPRIYPSTPGVAGIGCEGAAINFLDDAVFLSERGLEGVSKEQLNLERTIGHRSSNVDRLLRACDLSRAKMCRWGGYLCIFDGTGKVFMGDSRQLFQGIDGSAEYEWYYLEGIGDFEGDGKRYRTVTQYPELRFDNIPEGATLEGALLLGEPLAVDTESVYVEADELYTGEAEFEVDGVVYTVPVKYVEREGTKILCDSDGELAGGVFSPARIGFSVDGVLFFGTEGGTLCCFNTDKRGESVDGDEVESDAIHRSWYSFAGHRYLSGLALKSDNCDVPHLTKRTVRKTCVMKLKTMRGASVNVKIRTDREAWHEVMTSFAGTEFSFSDMEFDNFAFLSESDTIVTVKDKEKKWVEKQFYLFSDGWRRPFGLHSLTFNYEIQGRVKKG